MSLADELLAPSARLAMLADVPARQVETDVVLTLEARRDRIAPRIERLERQKRAVLREGAKATLAVEREKLARRYKQLDAQALDLQAEISDFDEKLGRAKRLCRIRMKLPQLTAAGLWGMLEDVQVGELDQFLADAATKAGQGDGQAKRLLEILQMPDASPA